MCYDFGTICKSNDQYRRMIFYVVIDFFRLVLGLKLGCCDLQMIIVKVTDLQIFSCSGSIKKKNY